MISISANILPAAVTAGVATVALTVTELFGFSSTAVTVDTGAVGGTKKS